MIKGAGDKYNYYSVSPKRRCILLNWSYELTENDVIITYMLLIILYPKLKSG